MIKRLGTGVVHTECDGIIINKKYNKGFKGCPLILIIMSNLKKCLDNNLNNETIINKHVLKNKRSMRNLLQSINKNYILYDTDPIIKNAYYNAYVPRKIIVKKEKVVISREINNLEDLIQLIKDFPIISNAEYNIDLE